MAPDEPPTGLTVTCPDCGRRSAADQPLCECGYPLEFDRERAVVHAAPSVTRAPGEQDDDTAELPPVVDEPPDDRRPVTIAPGASARAPTSGSGRCLACGEDNPADRTWCARCGQRLRAAQVPPVVPVTPAGDPPSRAALVLAAVVTVLLVVAVGAAAWWVRARDTATPSPSAVAEPTGGATAAAPTSRRLPAGRVRVTASSTQRDDCVCRAALMLDGRLDTAWNHDGDVVRPEGVRLRFTFREPVHVVGVAVVNGYVKTNSAGADLWQGNRRVAEAELTGAGAPQLVTFADTRDWQEVPVDLGTTSVVVLRVAKTYPGATWQDVALSEVRFVVTP